jgi:hypothetical protein
MTKKNSSLVVKNIKRDENIVVIFQSVLFHCPFEQDLEGNIDQLINKADGIS